MYTPEEERLEQSLKGYTGLEIAQQIQGLNKRIKAYQDELKELQELFQSLAAEYYVDATRDFSRGKYDAYTYATKKVKDAITWLQDEEKKEAR